MPNATSGQDGNLWFAEQATDKVARITTAGKVTEFSVSSGAAPEGITGGRSKLWFTEPGGNRIGRITLSARQP